MALIRSDCIRKPVTPVPKSYVPPNSEPYKVQDGDSWEIVARRRNTNAWALIRLNYPNLPSNVRQASLEVNWYLQEYVHCRALTPDGKNYRFDSRAGHIFVPKNGAAAATKPIVSYWRSNVVLPFMRAEMVTNSQSAEAKDCERLNAPPDPLVDIMGASVGVVGSSGDVWVGAHAAALFKWRELVRSGAKWDHKKQLRDLLSLRPGDWHFPIAGDADHEYYYDIWSNIHYGYVGSAAGFSDIELQAGAALGGAAGTNDDIDVETVQIGIDLWQRYGVNLTEDQLRKEILARRDKMLTIQSTSAYVEAQRRGGDAGFRHITGIQDGQ